MQDLQMVMDDGDGNMFKYVHVNMFFKQVLTVGVIMIIVMIVIWGC